MEMNKQNVDNSQLDIFSLIKELSRKQEEASASPSTNGKASIDAAVRSLISAALKQSPKSRYEVAASMSEILGVEISKSQLDAWSAESKVEHRFPLVYTAAFCIATADKSLARYLAQMCEGFFIESKEALLLELGRIEEQKEKLASKEQTIRSFLNGGGKA